MGIQHKEEWRPIGEGWPYEASSDGRIRRSEAAGGLMAGHVLAQYTKNRRTGYPCVMLRPFVHTLVARAFLGERPEGYVVNHKDGDKNNSRPGNLEYVTRADNQYHALETGLSPTRGETHPLAKLSEVQIREIRARYTGAWGEQGRLGKEYGVSQMLIGQIVRGEIWTHLDLDYEPKQYRPKKGEPKRGKRAKLTEANVREIRKQHSEGCGQEFLAAKYKVGRQIIRNLVYHKTWKHIK